MAEVLGLALPFFGLIFLGYACGRIAKIDEHGLAWLNFFILYVALPALFFYLVSRTPFEEIANWSFVLATTLATFWCFALSLLVGFLLRRGNLPEATIAAVVGAYANVGYMGPGLTLAALGPQATVPTALIFTFDSAMFFAAVPFLMALGGAEEMSAGRMARPRGAARVYASLHRCNDSRRVRGLATLQAAGRDRYNSRIPQERRRAPCTVHAGSHRSAQADGEDPRRSTGALDDQARGAPAARVGDAVAGGKLRSGLGLLLMAALPPALNAFIMARQYHVYIEQASSGILFGTIASVVTVTAMLYFLKNGLLTPNLFQ